MSTVDFGTAMALAEQGYRTWEAKEHNRKWVRRIDGTPIVNDLLVNIAEAITKSSLMVSDDDAEPETTQAWESDFTNQLRARATCIRATDFEHIGQKDAREFADLFDKAAAAIDGRNAKLAEIHSALDEALGDTDVTHIEHDEELRHEYPVQWAAEKLAAIITGD